MKKISKKFDTSHTATCEVCQGFGTVSGLWGMLTECRGCDGLGEVPLNMDADREQIKEGDIITCRQCHHEFPLTNPIIVCPKCGKETWF